MRWVQKEDQTFQRTDLKAHERWQYYISSFLRTEPTEGVHRDLMQKVVLTRNLPSGDNDSDSEYQPKAVAYHEGLSVKVCVNTAKLLFEKGTSNYFIYNLPSGSEEERKVREQRSKIACEVKSARFIEKMAMNSPWMKNLSQDEVQRAKEDYRKWKDEGVIPLQRTNDEELGGQLSACDE